MTIASPLRLTLLGALLGLNLAAQAAPSAPVAVSFDTTPRAGQQQRQQIDLQAVIKARLEAGPDATEEQRAKMAKAAENMERMGQMKMAMRMEQTMKVGAPDAQGWLPMTVAVGAKGGSVEMGGKVNPLPNLAKADMSFAARFNPKDFGFEVQAVEAGSAEGNEMMRNLGNKTIGDSLQLFKALSQRPLKIGESIEVPLNMSLPMPLPGGANNMQGLLHYTLARVDKGVAHFDLSMDLKMELNTPVPRPPAAASAAGAETADAPPQMLHMVLSGGGKGTSSLRLADRLPLASRLAMDMKMTMDGPDNGRMFMDMDMVVESKGESLAKPVAAKKKP
ncbi:hypothetical protein J2X20_004482 [Pelomonas saccharophila]|uniref:Uncharacterized protein n=1 Tax=Roseateles saccharophilus TaxID=304 RepID=A0ABU1YSH7_ROSSA|nr:hypothetical protein [Roseateles saccharophilus]MDR7271814.1 hypothetical protein [Roseateles saccharophilus]